MLLTQDGDQEPTAQLYIPIDDLETFAQGHVKDFVKRVYMTDSATETKTPKEFRSYLMRTYLFGTGLVYDKCVLYHTGRKNHSPPRPSTPAIATPVRQDTSPAADRASPVQLDFGGSPSPGAALNAMHKFPGAMNRVGAALMNLEDTHTDDQLPTSSATAREQHTEVSSSNVHPEGHKKRRYGVICLKCRK